MTDLLKETMNDRILDLLDQSGLNWEVTKEPLFSAVDGSETDAFGIFKKTDRTFLCATGKRYTPFQNSELAKSILIASDSLGLPITNGGELGGGKKVFLQAALPDAYVGRSGIKRHITALNSHDGSSSIGFGSSNTVIVCQNTFFHSYRDLNKVRHTMSAGERVKTMAMDLNKALLNDNRLIDTFKQFDSVTLKDEMVERVIRKIFDIDAKQNQTELSSRKKNQVIAFADALTTEIGLEGNTVWALFNASTRLTNHVLAPKTPNGKLDYLMNGRGYEIGEMTYNTLCDMIGIENNEMVVV